MLRLARVSVRSLSHTRILASGPAPFNNLPGSFLNGEDGRTMEKVADIGPPAAEEVLFLEFAKKYTKKCISSSGLQVTRVLQPR